jgi:7-cyano-7-deazaguanine synthase
VCDDVVQTIMCAGGRKIDDARNVLVLLSGGVDSATVLATVRTDRAAAPQALFVDYGQPAARREAEASRALAAYYGVSHRALELRGFTATSGEVPARNAFLVHTALMSFGYSAGLIALGVHAGTGYRDCSPTFVEVMQRSLEFHSDGTVGLVTPLLGFSKLEVFRLAIATHVPVDITFSCEAANEACGACLSCRDREEFGAGA